MVIISDTEITLNQVKLVIFYVQYNHARYTSRGGSKPFLAGFQPPKIINDQASAASSKKVFCLVSLNIKVILSPRHLNAVLTRCDRAFLCSRTPEAPEQTAGEYIPMTWGSGSQPFFPPGALWSKCKNHGHVIEILRHQYKPTRFITLYIA